MVILILGIGSFIHGFDYGVEFKGGRSYVVKFDQPANVEQVRNDLAKTFGENPVIKTIGSANQLDITTSYMIDNTEPEADQVVAQKLMEGLKNHLPANLSFSPV